MRYSSIVVHNQTPIGSLIIYTYQDNPNLGGPILQEKLENFFDLLKYRAKTRGVASALDTLKEELFEIRFDFLKLLSEDNSYLKDLDETLLNIIWDKFNEPSKGPLTMASLNALNTYIKIISPLGSSIIDVLETKSLSLGESIPNYHDFKTLITLYPSSPLTDFKHF